MRAQVVDVIVVGAGNAAFCAALAAHEHGAKVSAGNGRFPVGSIRTVAGLLALPRSARSPGIATPVQIVSDAYGRQ